MAGAAAANASIIRPMRGGGAVDRGAQALLEIGIVAARRCRAACGARPRVAAIGIGRVEQRADVEIEQRAGHPVDRRRHRLDLFRRRDRGGNARVELGVETGRLRGGAASTGPQRPNQKLAMNGSSSARSGADETPSPQFGCLLHRLDEPFRRGSLAGPSQPARRDAAAARIAPSSPMLARSCRHTRRWRTDRRCRIGRSARGGGDSGDHHRARQREPRCEEAGEDAPSISGSGGAHASRHHPRP